MVGGSNTTVDRRAVTLVKATNTNILAQVDVTGNGGGTLVEPASGVLRRKLLGARGLHDLNVAGNVKSTLTLKETGVCVDELLSRDVLDGDTSHFLYNLGLMDLREQIDFLSSREGPNVASTHVSEISSRENPRDALNR